MNSEVLYCFLNTKEVLPHDFASAQPLCVETRAPFIGKRRIHRKSSKSRHKARVGVDAGCDNVSVIADGNPETLFRGSYRAMRNVCPFHFHLLIVSSSRSD